MDSEDEISFLITKKELIQAVGAKYIDALVSLASQGLINSWQDAIEIRMDKQKSIYLQTILEFGRAQDLPKTVQGRKDKHKIED
jgi:hypothetical protein